MEKILFMVTFPNKQPRIGYPVGDLETSVRDWVAKNPDGEVFVLQCSHDGWPTPGTAIIETAESFLQIFEVP